jgi:hypothetical protein
VKKMFSNVLDFRYNYLLTPAEIVLSVFWKYGNLF